MSGEVLGARPAGLVRGARAWAGPGWLLGPALIALPAVLVAVLVVYPGLSTIWGTFQAQGADGAAAAPTLDNYRRFLTDPYSLGNLARTAWTTAVTTALLLVGCLPVALYLRFRQSRLAAAVQALALFPMFVPGIIIAYALIRTIGPHGVLDTVLNHLGVHGYISPYLTRWGPVIGLFWDGMPLTLLILGAGLAGVPDHAIEAARDVGARPLRVLFTIVLPLMRSSLIVVTALNVLGIFSAFVIPYMLGPASPEMMGPFMLRTFSVVRDPVQASTQAVVTFAICAVFGLFYVRSITRRRDADAA